MPGTSMAPEWKLAPEKGFRAVAKVTPGAAEIRTLVALPRKFSPLLGVAPPGIKTLRSLTDAVSLPVIWFRVSTDTPLPAFRVRTVSSPPLPTRSSASVDS
jgi:hypothetical protein